MTETDAAHTCMACGKVDLYLLVDLIWPPPFPGEEGDRWRCAKCGSADFYVSQVTIGGNGNITDETGTIVAVKLIPGRVYEITHVPGETSATVLFVGRLPEPIKFYQWAYPDGSKDLVLTEEQILDVRAGSE